MKLKKIEVDDKREIVLEKLVKSWLTEKGIPINV